MKVNRVVSISISAVLFITLLALAACGGFSTPTEPAAEPTDTPLPSITDTPEPASASAYDTAVTMAGRWVGEWNNLTVSSSGSTTAEIDVREDVTATITFDLNGNVFGLFDHPPITFEVSFDADGLT